MPCYMYIQAYKNDVNNVYYTDNMIRLKLQFIQYATCLVS